MTQAIETRYQELAESSCCLSCGTAVGHCRPEPGQVCVDLGSGRGTDVLRLAEQVGPTGHAYGLDITEAMLDKARKTATKLGVENATFLRSELEELALPDCTADWVTSNCVLNHAADKGRVWREIARILKKGGQFVVSDIYAVEPVAAEYRDDPAAIAECWAGAITKDEYLLHVQRAGLVDVRILEEGEPYAKGKARVVSFTLAGRKTPGCCSCF
ncbi:MAG: methyltransferase domain-containing protein [Myxococcales bacterium]|nr:methyltransferase domain-containing protein [Myxococcales bacterium]